MKSPSLGVHVLKLLSGRAAIQVVSFLTIPIITRLFLPVHLGTIQVFESLVNILAVIICLQYEQAIPLARDEQETFASVLLSLAVTCGLTCVMVLLAVSGKTALAVWLKTPELQYFLWLLPVFVLLRGIDSTLMHWASREERFGTIALSDMGQAFPERAVQIGWGLVFGSSSAGLFVSRLTGTIGRAAVLLAALWGRLAASFKTIAITIEMVRAYAVRHKKFPLFTTWAVFFNNLAEQLPPLFFARYFSAAAVGFYSIGYRNIQLPLMILRTSLAKVFFPIAAKEYTTTGSLTTIVTQLFTRLIQIGAFPLAVILFTGPLLFSIVFGQQWEEAGVYARMIVIWQFLTFITAPLKVFEILDRQEIGLLMNVVITLGKAASLFVGVSLTGPRGTLAIFAVTSVCCITATLIWKLRLAHVSIVWGAKMLLLYAAICCGLLLPANLLFRIFDTPPVVLATLGIATVGYAGVLYLIDPSIRHFLQRVLTTRCKSV